MAKEIKAGKPLGKFMGRYVFRGSTAASENSNSPSSPNEFRIQMFDGRFDTGFVVRDFHIWCLDGEAHGSLRQDPFSKQGWIGDSKTSLFQASDSSQIAWSSHPGSGVGPIGASLVDPDNLTIEDLYVNCYASTDSQPINFMIIADKYDLSPATGTLTMVETNFNRRTP